MDMTPDPGTMLRKRDRRPPPAVVILATSIAALVVMAVVALRLADTHPAVLPPDTPAGSIQGYLVAYQAGDLEAAYLHFSSRVQRLLTFDEFERTASDWGDQDLGQQRIELTRVDETGDRATLLLRVESAGGGLFGSGRYGWDVTIRLVREGGTWHIDQPLAGIQTTYYE